MPIPTISTARPCARCLPRTPPRAVLVAAAATLDTARARTGLDGARLIPADAGDRMEAGSRDHAATSPGPPTRPSSRTPRAVTCFLGYAIGLGGQTILHSGDTIPFDGQAAEIAALNPGPCPAAGQRARRAAGPGHGIAGNLTASEAMALAEAAGVPEVIAHHFRHVRLQHRRPARPRRLVCPGRIGKKSAPRDRA